MCESAHCELPILSAMKNARRLVRGGVSCIYVRRTVWAIRSRVARWESTINHHACMWSMLVFGVASSRADASRPWGHKRIETLATIALAVHPRCCGPCLMAWDSVQVLSCWWKPLNAPESMDAYCLPPLVDYCLWSGGCIGYTVRAPVKSQLAIIDRQLLGTHPHR